MIIILKIEKFTFIIIRKTYLLTVRFQIFNITGPSNQSLIHFFKGDEFQNRNDGFGYECQSTTPM